MRNETRLFGGLDGNDAAGHALADVIVGITFQQQIQAIMVPYAEALAGRTTQFDGQATGRQAFRPMCAGDFAGQARAYRAIHVAHGIFQCRWHFGLDAVHGILDHVFCQFALVKRWVGGFHAEARFGLRDAALAQQCLQIQTPLTRGIAGIEFEQVDAADQFFDTADTQLGHPFARFHCDESKEVHNHFRQADEMLLAQTFVLSRHAGSAVVEVANAQVFAA
ncbi:hypothetical protein GALL_526940 [mine drainage metagenome]|uniref:Uncharacterized protein n=1 Tax=mine drainage metagenome TaxID=410659 RepID=A0A1J5P4T3_9ZZZZ